MTDDSLNVVAPSALEPAPEPFAASLEALEPAPLTAVTPTPVPGPESPVAAPVMPVSSVHLAIEKWFASVFPGSQIASAPGNWNKLLEAKSALMEIVAIHANASLK